MRFIKIGKYVINPNLITSIDTTNERGSKLNFTGCNEEDGGCTVNFSGGSSLRLSTDETQSLMDVVAPVGS